MQSGCSHYHHLYTNVYILLQSGVYCCTICKSSSKKRTMAVNIIFINKYYTKNVVVGNIVLKRGDVVLFIKLTALNLFKIELV